MDDPLRDETVNSLGMLKTHLPLGGMDVYIHLFGGHLHI